MALGECDPERGVDWRCSGRIMRLGELSTGNVDRDVIVWMSRALAMCVERWRWYREIR